MGSQQGRKRGRDRVRPPMPEGFADSHRAELNAATGSEQRRDRLPAVFLFVVRRRRVRAGNRGSPCGTVAGRANAPDDRLRVIRHSGLRELRRVTLTLTRPTKSRLALRALVASSCRPTLCKPAQHSARQATNGTASQCCQCSCATPASARRYSRNVSRSAVGVAT